MSQRTVLYGLFEKQDGKWVRLYPTLSYTRTRAISIFQDALLAYAFGMTAYERRLRPVGHKL